MPGGPHTTRRTLLRILRVARRTWLVAALGLAATLGFALHTWQSPGVYWGQVDVVLVTPPSALAPNSLGIVSGSLIATAGVLQREVMGGPDSSRVVSDVVTLLDEGVSSGVLVTLPNAGGQWANNFDRPVLHVQSVDTRATVALDGMRAMVREIDSVLTRQQDAAGVDPAQRIITRLSPPTMTVAHHVGERRRATAASMLLGLGLTGASVVLVDRRHRRHRGVRADDRETEISRMMA